MVFAGATDLHVPNVLNSLIPSGSRSQIDLRSAFPGQVGAVTSESWRQLETTKQPLGKSPVGMR